LHDYSQGMCETKKQSGFLTKLCAQCTGPQLYKAPEAIERLEFTTAADVYSFGRPCSPLPDCAGA